MTKIIENIVGFSERGRCALAVTGSLLLLTVGMAPAQTPDDLSTSAQSDPSVSITANPAGAPAEVSDEGESSAAFEFVSPVRAVTTAPGAAASGGSPVVNPMSTTLADGTVHVLTENATLTPGVPRADTGLSATAKAGVCVLIACGLLGLGAASLRAMMIQQRTRGNSLEA